jgi:hypothetical protein
VLFLLQFNHRLRERKEESAMEEKEKPVRLLKNGNVQAKGGSFARMSKAELQELNAKSRESRARNKRQKQTAKEVLQALLASDSTDRDAAGIIENKGLESTELATLLFNMTKKASKSAQMAELVFRLNGDLQEAPQQQITIVNQLSDEQLEQERKRILDSTSDIIDITPEPPGLD